MRTKGFCCLLFCTLWLTAGGLAAGETLTATGQLDAVTVYRGQAMVTRVIRVELPAGVSELVVEGLPQHVVPESLFADGGEGIQIRAVRFRSRAVKEEPREEVRAIEARIEELQKERAKNQKLQKVAEQRTKYLDELEKFVAPTAQTELTKGILDADTLRDLTLFMFEQREEQAMDTVDLEQKGRDLDEQLALLRRKLAELTRRTERTVREAVVSLQSESAGPATLKLSYLVTEAGWEPVYNVRATGEDEAVEVEYNATVHQMSGEDWENVTVVLSTASPALRSRGPELGPFWVALSPQRAPLGPADLGTAEQIRARLSQSEVRQLTARSLEESVEAAWAMNVEANELQRLELQAGQELIRRLPERKPTEGLSVTYLLPGRISLPSRTDKQMLAIASLELESDFYFVAEPVLTTYVYREAELVNDSDLALLEGPASVYLNGGFVGRTEIPMVAVGQTFTVGLGIDSQLRAGRELTDKTERALGANKEMTSTYRLTLENYKDKPVQLRLYDRVPHPTEEADIRVTLGAMTDELSTEALYLQREKPKGILRWDIEVPAKSFGADARTLEYHYSLEFDGKLHIGTPVEISMASAGRRGTAAQEAAVQTRLKLQFQEFSEKRRAAR